MMDASDWVSAHAFCHGDLDHLVTEAVAPLVEELDAAHALRGWFFLRYWEGGPHARLRLLPAQGHRSRVESALRDHVARYFHAHPSRDRMRRDRYLHLASMYAQRERRSVFAEEMYPNDTLVFLPYEREHDRYGRGAAIEAVERHFAESSRIALRLLTKGVSPDQRATTACAVILLTWLVGEPDVRRLADLVSATGSTAPPSGDPLGLDGRPRSAERERQRDRAVGIARSMRSLAAHVGDMPRSGTFVDWARSVTGLRADLERVPAPDRPGGESFQVLDTCAHLFCNRLGLLLNGEDVVRGTAAEAVSALAGEEAAPERGNPRGLA